MKDKLTLKNILRSIVAFVGMIFILYCITAFIKDVNSENEYTDCGFIESKSTDEVAIKHGTSTELYLNIQFETAGFKSIKVEPTNYFKHKKGDYVCYVLDTENRKNIYAFCGCIFSFIIFAVVIVLFIVYLIPTSWKTDF